MSFVLKVCKAHRAAPNASQALAFCVASASLLLLPAIVSETAKGARPADGSQENPTELVREVMHNEIEAQLQDTSLWCFREEHKDDGKPEKSLEVCQTESGDIERVTAVNGRELSADEKDAEGKRVEKVIEHPEPLRAKQKKQQDDQEQARSLMKIFPDALRFEYQGREGDLLKLSFHPNPNFHPATRSAVVLHHLQGILVVDARRKRLLEVHEIGRAHV